jgi:alkanesulfonate monooxygenase SsuD/methylene tetrahydromethanopterin reductase-like flavin-dependent oxidoreductase (luciferase family)
MTEPPSPRRSVLAGSVSRHPKIAGLQGMSPLAARPPRARGLGVPFPLVGERYERLEETLQICAQMWDPHDNGPFEGKHYKLAESLCSPQPIHRPSVLIGAGGERMAPAISLPADLG